MRSKSNRGIGWHLIHSIFFLLDLSFFLTGIGMVLRGNSVKVKKWKILGSLYFAIIWICIIVGGEQSNSESTLSNIVYTTAFLVYFVCIIHSFRINREYLMRLEIVMDSKPKTNAIKYQEIREEYQKTNSEIEEHASLNTDLKSKTIVPNSKTVNQVNTNVKSLAQTIGTDNLIIEEINTKEVMANEPIESIINQSQEINNQMNKDENLKIDINICSESDFVHRLGVGIIMAKKAIVYRSTNGGFVSMVEFYKLINAKDYNISKLSILAFCDTKTERLTAKMGRRVDY